MNYSLSFRETHLLSLLTDYDQQGLPIDVCVANYFRSHKALGSKDRKWLLEAIYPLIKWQGLIDYNTPRPISWQKRLRTFLSHSIPELQAKNGTPPHISCSFPQFLFAKLLDFYGEETTLQICHTLNEKAPITLRTNPIKISREQLLSKLDPNVFCKTHLAPHGISCLKRVNLHDLAEYREGFFEIQDEASQLVADMIDARPKQQILDYCSGSGGKSLAFAHKMQGTGQIFLHDIRQSALKQAKKRCKRAGIHHAQFNLPLLKNKMDWVIVDAPCSGTGTLRRNPDMKWKLTKEAIDELVEKQRDIFKQALCYMKPNGLILYATCSILPEENESQTDYFLNTFPIKLHAPIFKTLPQSEGMDGFYAALFAFK